MLCLLYFNCTCNKTHHSYTRHLYQLDTDDIQEEETYAYGKTAHVLTDSCREQVRATASYQGVREAEHIQFIDKNTYTYFTVTKDSGK